MKQLFLHWYQDRGRTIFSEYMAMMYMIYDDIAKNGTDGAMVRVSAEIVDAEERTLKRMIDFTYSSFCTLNMHHS